MDMRNRNPMQLMVCIGLTVWLLRCSAPVEPGGHDIVLAGAPVVVADRGETVRLRARIDADADAPRRYVWYIDSAAAGSFRITTTDAPQLDTFFVKAGEYLVTVQAQTVQGSAIVSDTIRVKVFEDLIEYRFCWQELQRHFLYRDDMPSPWYGYDTPPQLYRATGDPYTRYTPPSQSAGFLDDLTTRTDSGHCGVRIDSVHNGYVIRDVVERSGARRAGLQRLDTIVTVNGDSVAGLPLSQLQTRLSGPEGEIISMELVRADSLVDTQILLTPFFWPSVFYDSLSAVTAYMAITSFSSATEHENGTYAEVYELLDTLAWADNLIVDLRQNLGGGLNQCFSALDVFVDSAEPFIRLRSWWFDTTTYTGSVEQTVFYSDTGNMVSPRLFVLVDGYTASASEIFVSAIRENRPQATIVGTTTFGKATGWTYAQTPRDGIASVTVLEIEPVSGPGYADIGITPDVVIEAHEDALSVAQAMIGDTVAARRMAGIHGMPRGYPRPSAYAAMPGVLVDRPLLQRLQARDRH
jgi:C-terminal peptidase prc